MNIIKNFFLRPPVIFPLVALFLVFLSISEWQLYTAPGDIDGFYKLRPIYMSLYAITWIGATFFKKWGAFSFMFLSVVGLAINFLLPMTAIQATIGNLLLLHVPLNGQIFPLPFNILFSFSILFHYKLMR